MTVERLKRALDWQSVPALSEDDIADLVWMTSEKDEDGDPITVDGDIDGAPIFNFRAACYEGWGRKAAKAAAMYDFQADDARYTRSQIYAHCIAQHKRYGFVGSLSTTEG